GKRQAFWPAKLVDPRLLLEPPDARPPVLLITRRFAYMPHVREHCRAFGPQQISGKRFVAHQLRLQLLKRQPHALRRRLPPAAKLHHVANLRSLQILQHVAPLSRCHSERSEESSHSIELPDPSLRSG